MDKTDLAIKSRELRDVTEKNQADNERVYELSRKLPAKEGYELLLLFKAKEERAIKASQLVHETWPEIKESVMGIWDAVKNTEGDYDE